MVSPVGTAPQVSIGIDFSITSTGIYVEGPNEHFVVRTVPKYGMEYRVTKVLRVVDALLKKYPEALVVLEAPAFGAKGSRVYQLFGAHFMVWMLIQRHSRRLLTVPPTTLKKFATGNGRADKQMMVTQLPEDIKKELVANYKKTTGLFDVVDGYWLAQYGLAQHEGGV